MWTTYWFGINDEESELCGEEFFTELFTEAKGKELKEMHVEYAKSIFPNETLTCYGRVSREEAEMMGLDTYQELDMAKKKKKENIGIITAEELLRTTKGIQDIPFRTGAHDKRKPRERINRNNIDRYLQRFLLFF